jgi:DNA-binding MarR family transcriptional regulator
VDTDIGIDATAVANRLRPVLLRINRQLRRELGTLGVTSTQASLLAAIRLQPGVGLTSLAAHEGMSTASLCTHIDRLEAGGLVERQPSAADRRRIGLCLTEQGAVLLDAVRAQRTIWLAERLGMLDQRDLAAIEASIDPLQRLLEVGS